MTTTSVSMVAAELLRRASDASVPVSNLQLQKLVTFVQSLSVYALGKPAFREDVQAWKNGPAVKPLYGAYKRFGADPITEIVRPRHSGGTVAPDVKRVIDEVWAVAGGLTGGDLWTISHTVGPWERYYRADVQDTTIPNDALGSAWVQYLEAVLALKSPIQDSEPVVGRGQLGYGSEALAAYAINNFRPARVPARA